MSEDFQIYMTGKVVEGEMQGIPRKRLKEELRHFEGKPIELIIRRKKKHRSNQQNRLYWVYMGMIGEYLGYSKDEIHEICKYKFLKKETADETTGEIFQYIQSTSKLSTVEFMEYIENLYKWSAETFGLTLPEPNSQMEMNVMVAEYDYEKNETIIKKA